MLYNPFTLEGKTILVTGASSGIGRTTAIECSKMGANVIITGRNIERLQETFNQMDSNDSHQQIVGDLTIPEDLDNIVVNTPPLDGLVNNAGISFTKPIGYLKYDDLRTVFDTNTFAPILLTNNLLH